MLFQIELKLAKVQAFNWTSLLSTSGTNPTPSSTSPNTIQQQTQPTTPAVQPKAKVKVTKNWDKLVTDELDEKENPSDPVIHLHSSLLSPFFTTC
jgi:hypothetical protein